MTADRLAFCRMTLDMDTLHVHVRRVLWLSASTYRLIVLLMMSLTQSEATSLANPCTSEALKRGEFYHPFLLDRRSFVQCDQSGVPHIRPCPPGQIWSQSDITCVLEPVDGKPTTRAPQPSPAEWKQKWKRMMMQSKQQWQMKHSGSQQNGAGPGTQANGGQKSWQTGSGGAGSSHGDKQQWMMPLGQGDTAYGSGKSWMTPSPWQQPIGLGSTTMPVKGGAGWQDQDATTMTVLKKPCSLLKVHFLPHPYNANRYYECVGVYFAERLCPSDRVWSQKRRMCVESIGTTRSTPTTTSAPGMNPCRAAGVDASWSAQMRQLPYPGDRSRFIICHDSTRFDVYHCAAGLVWLQTVQICGPDTSNQTSSKNHAMGGVTTQNPWAKTTTVAGSQMASICWSGSSKSFYHSYPPDSSKFLQCDDFGNVFVRQCAPGTVWHDGYKTCVGGTKDSSVSTTVANQQGQGHYKGQGHGQWKQDTTTVAQKQGQSHYGQGDGQSGSGQWQQGQGQDQGQGHGATAGIFLIVCPWKYEYDVKRGMCVKKSGWVKTGTSLSCPSGFTWSKTLRVCIQRIATSADAPTSMQPGSSKSWSGQMSDDKQDATSTPPTLPEAKNPCVQGAGLYFPFPNNSAYFVQCDLAGSAFVQPCPSGLEWSQGMLTCTLPPQSAKNVNGGDMSSMALTTSSTTYDQLDLSKLVDPCSLPFNDGLVFPNPLNAAVYMQCSGGSAILLHCPPDTVWSQHHLSCVSDSSLSSYLASD